MDHDVDSFWNNQAASATVGDIEKWFEQSGYADVKSEDNLVESLDPSDIDDLNRYYSQGRRVILAITSCDVVRAPGKRNDL